MDKQAIEEILSRIPEAKVAIYGDFCLDVYWTLDPKGSEVSVETGIPAQSVAEARYFPGGAGNIVKNMAALGGKNMACTGIIGADIFGQELRRLLRNMGAQVEGLSIQDKDFATYTYIKRYLNGFEEARIDFGMNNSRRAPNEEQVLATLAHLAESHQVLIINQQVPGSMDNERFREQLNDLVSHADARILVDSRHYSHSFQQVHFKINSFELAQLFGKHLRHLSEKDLEALAFRLFEKTQHPVFVTRGPKGIWVINDQGLRRIAGIELEGDIDPVGAGDTVVSTLALCLAAGASEYQAAYLANIAAAITVKKLFQTGTASQSEIWEQLSPYFPKANIPTSPNDNNF